MGKADWERMSGIVLMGEYRHLVEVTDWVGEARRLLGRTDVIPDALTSNLAGIHLQLITDRREMGEYIKQRLVRGDAAELMLTATERTDMEQE